MNHSANTRSVSPSSSEDESTICWQNSSRDAFQRPILNRSLGPQARLWQISKQLVAATIRHFLKYQVYLSSAKSRDGISTVRIVSFFSSGKSYRPPSKSPDMLFLSTSFPPHARLTLPLNYTSKHETHSLNK